MTEPAKYLLLDRIAVGGMAEVYRAKSLGVEGFERIIAMKRIIPELAKDEEFVSMFITEAKIAGQLSHANIAPIYELGKIGGVHFIAMEYVWGKDLRQIAARWKRIGQPMPPPMAAWIVTRMLEGLDYAHRKRGADGRPLAIIHRDVSPQNVLVSYDGLVKLIDFGIAKAASRATQTQAGVIKGKLAYMSPEQVRGLPMDHRSDVFAATSLFHELLTGEQLFRGPNDIEVLDKVRMASARPPSEVAPHVPVELDAIVMKGLAREPADRYQTAGEMQEDLMRYVASQRPPYTTTSLAQWMRVAFAPEINKERAHLEQLSAVSSPGVRVADDERPMASQPPAHAAPAASEEYEELSRLVMVEEISLEASLASMPLPPASVPPASAPVAAPVVAPVAAAESYAPPVPVTTPPPMPPAPSQLGNTMPMQGFVMPQGAPMVPAPVVQPAPGVAIPQISPAAMQAPSTPAPAPAAVKKKSRWPWVMVALLFVLLSGGGAAAWIFRFGGRALLGF